MDIHILIKQLTGDITEFDNARYDCYVRKTFGIFIPIFAESEHPVTTHVHPAYEIVIDFSMDSEKPKHYWATITSPAITHRKNQSMHCYSVFIEKEYFEKRFRMYAEEVPVFQEKTLNFALIY